MKFIAIIMLFYVGCGVTSEIDSFTRRYETLEDVSEALNTKSNELLDAAIKNANKKLGCSTERLLWKIRYRFSYPLTSKFRVYLMKKAPFEKRVIKVKDSIYKKLNPFDSPSLGFASHFKIKSLGSVFRIGDFIIGSDKFAHIFNRGYGYYTLHYVKNRSILKTIKRGNWTEKTFWGSLTTGIYSYSDVAANFIGMRFYNEIVGNRPDVVTGQLPPNPYVKCVNDQWVQVREIDWRNYIDASFDESYNCSAFRNKSILKKVLSAIGDLERDGNRYTCPLDARKLEHAAQKYGEYRKFFINETHTVFKKIPYKL